MIVCCGVCGARGRRRFPGVTGAWGQALTALGREAHYVENMSDAPAALTALVGPATGAHRPGT